MTKSHETMPSTPTIWTTRCPLPTALSIAGASGSLARALAERGVSFQSLASSTDPAVREAHFVQSLPWFVRQGGNTPPLVSASRGRRLKILGLTFAASNEGLFALPERGIEKPGDLRGKRVSLPRQVNDPVDFWQATVRDGVGHALRLAGLSEDDIEWVDVAIERTYVSRSAAGTDAAKTLWDSRFMLGHQREEAAALLAGRVDAVYSSGSIATLMSGFTGAVKVVDTGSAADPVGRFGNSTPTVLTTTAELYDERPDLVDLLVEEVSLAAAWARRNVADARRVIALETGLPEDLVEDAWGADVQERLQIDLDDERVQALQEKLSALARQGVLAGPVRLNDLIAPEPLERVKRKLSGSTAAAAFGSGQLAAPS